MCRATIRSLLLVVVLALAAACAEVPSGSEPVAVRHVDPSDIGGAAPEVYAVPPGPTPHMSSRDVVDGFLRASSAGVESRHQVARGFLTPAAAASWQDTAEATVYSQPLVDDQADGLVQVTATRKATITRDGAYHANPGRVTVRFRLSKVKGEWRIANPPAGIYVQSSDFAQNFHSADVYFLSPSRNLLVPDPRFFEVPTTSMANRLMQALLAGPSQWLVPAVVSDVPRGASLRSNVVDDSPTVSVDLTNLGSMGQAQLKGMSAQIVYTIAKYNSSAVRILSDGQLLAVPGAQKDQQLADWQSYDAEVLPASAPLYFVHSGAVWTSDGHPAPGPAGKAYYTLASVAVPTNGTKMAGVTHRDGQDQLFAGPVNGTLTKRFHGQTLTPPTWGGQSSEVWTVRDGTDVIRVPVDGASGGGQIIASPAVSRVGPVTAMKLSRDGTRAALIGRDGRLYVGRVSHATDSVTIDGLRELALGQHGFTDVAWAAGDEILALAPNSTGSVVPWDLSTDGSRRQAEGIDTLPAPPTGIAAASDRLTVVSSKNALWYYDRSTWTRVTASGRNTTLHGSAPAYPD